MPSDIVSKVVSKVGSIVPDDDSDTDDFVARDTVSADADRQQQAEARPHSPTPLAVPCRRLRGCCWQMQLLVLLLEIQMALLDRSQCQRRCISAVSRLYLGCISADRTQCQRRRRRPLRLRTPQKLPPRTYAHGGSAACPIAERPRRHARARTQELCAQSCAFQRARRLCESECRVHLRLRVPRLRCSRCLPLLTRRPRLTY